LNEITSEQRMDYLLDKVSENGFESLSPTEKIELRRLSGEDVGSEEENDVETSDETEYNDYNLELSDVNEFIDNNFPDGITFNIGNTTWSAFIDRELKDSELKITITDGDRLIDVFPFKDGENKIKVLSTERAPFTGNIKKVPANMDEAEYFMRTLINVEIPKIINFVLKTS
jgi:hypothetical protein